MEAAFYYQSIMLRRKNRCGIGLLFLSPLIAKQHEDTAAD